MVAIWYHGTVKMRCFTVGTFGIYGFIYLIMLWGFRVGHLTWTVPKETTTLREYPICFLHAFPINYSSLRVSLLWLLTAGSYFLLYGYSSSVHVHQTHSLRNAEVFLQNKLGDLQCLALPLAQRIYKIHVCIYVVLWHGYVPAHPTFRDLVPMCDNLTGTHNCKHRFDNFVVQTAMQDTVLQQRAYHAKNDARFDRSSTVQDVPKAVHHSGSRISKIDSGFLLIWKLPPAGVSGNLKRNSLTYKVLLVY